MSDGTVEGTRLAVGVNDVATWYSNRLVAFGDQLIFASPTAEDGFALWSIDVPPAPLEGDINGDGMVGFEDFLVLSQNFNQQVTGGPIDGDVDEDGIVSFSDFLVISSQFGRSI